MRKYFYGIAITVLLLVQAPVNAQDIGPNVKTILFLGNSITWMGNYANDVETWLTVHYPGRHFECINAGVPSETVSGLSEEGHAGGQFPRPDLHERLQRVLEQIKPDLVFACYGMNDGIYQPFDAGRFQKFKDGINWMHNEIIKTGARLIHITPPVYDGMIAGNAFYDSVLDRYADWLLSLRKSAKWEVLDVHYAMQKYLKAHREVDAKYHLDGFALAGDGVHPFEIGHWIMARQILVYLGCKDAATCPSIAHDMAAITNGAQILKFVTERGNMMRDAWLRSTKHKRPGLPEGLPLDEALARSAELHKEINALVLNKNIAEVYLLGGGSNATGVDDTNSIGDSVKASSNVILFNPAPAGRVGLENGFSSKIQAVVPNARIAVVTYAAAGSNLYRDWNPGADENDTAGMGAQFKAFIKTVNETMDSLRSLGYEPIIKGMLWQQGEGDALIDSSSIQYGINLRYFIERVRQQTGGVPFAFVYGYASSPSSNMAGIRTIIQAEHDIDQDAGTAYSVKYAHAVKTDDLVSLKRPNGTQPGDEYYFDAKSIWLLGIRMAEKINIVNGK